MWSASYKDHLGLLVRKILENIWSSHGIWQGSIVLGQQRIVQPPGLGVESWLQVNTFFFGLFRAAPMAYGGSQAWSQIRAVAASLHHSHSNARSELCRQPSPQLMAQWILNPLSEARVRTWVLMDTSQIHFYWATTGTPIWTLTEWRQVM